MHHIFTTFDGGNHKICFQNLGTLYLQFEFHLKTGIEAKDYDAIVKESHLKPAELEAKKVEDQVKDLQKIMKFGLKIGDRLRSESLSIKDSVKQHGIISIVFMVVATGLSSLYLRSYFKKRKDK